MPKVPAYDRSLNLVKGEPKGKIKKTTIDRAKYQDILDKPLDAGQDNLVANDPESLVPEILGPQGFNYYSGTIKGKDAIYKKGNNYYMYNEKPNEKNGSSYGLVNIGDLSEPKIQLPQDSIPTVKPQIIDPMKVEGFNGMLAPRVEQYKNGGKVKGYYNGGDTEYDSGMSTDASLSPSPNSTYSSAISAANQRNLDKQNLKKDNTQRNANIRTGANVAGRALGAYGTGYYASTPQENESDETRAKTLAAVGQTGPIGGAVSGIAAIGDKIGKPIKERSERVDAQGNLIDPSAAGRNAVIGGLFSPSKALATRNEMKKAGFDGFKIKGAKKEYTRFLEDKAKDAIEAEQKAENEAIQEQIGLTNAMKIQNALSAREAGDTSFQESLVTPQLKTFASLRPNNGYSPEATDKMKTKEELDAIAASNAPKKKKWYQFADGGVVSGKGGPKSDSINAKVEAGSFIVPAENAPIAKELAAKVLKKAPMRKANLNQGGETPVKLSDGEYMFTPEEKAELIAKGVNLKALAPNAEETAALKCGGRVPKYAKGTNEKGVPPAKKEAAYMSKDIKNQDIRKRQELLTKKQMLEANLAKNPNDYFSKAALQDANTRIARYNQMYGEPIEQLVSDAELEELTSKLPNAKPSASAVKAKSAIARSVNLEPNYLGVKDDISIEPPSNVNSQGEVIIPEATLPEFTSATMKSSVGNANATNPSDAPVPAAKSKVDLQGLADNAIGYGLPIVQGAIGFNKLKELGKRPKDKLDQDYLNAIATTSGDVATARQQAKFGFTGEEKAALAQENAALTNAGRFAARNLAGGSGANMLGAERSVINDAFGRKLSSRISDNALKMQKQEQAMARQQDLNNMVAHKAELNRRLYEDNLNAWSTDSVAAGNLINAGLSSALETTRYNKFKKQYDDVYKNQNG